MPSPAGKRSTQAEGCCRRVGTCKWAISYDLQWIRAGFLSPCPAGAHPCLQASPHRPRRLSPRPVSSRRTASPLFLERCKRPGISPGVWVPGRMVGHPASDPARDHHPHAPSPHPRPRSLRAAMLTEANNGDGGTTPRGATASSVKIPCGRPSCWLSAILRPGSLCG